ncbi:hypothetical protein ACFOWA_09085 [Pedobacter lithocola]|uniref:Uncharacterized protein n=1 Tax=Pedobacter lithocola TaxID=1908239 RepID=A0ABV8PB18_9SPHI
MKRLKLVLLILLASYFQKSFAQTGCLVSSNNTVYTVQDNSLGSLLTTIFGNPVYLPNPNEPSVSACVSNSQFRWVGASQNCTVCPQGYATVLGTVTGCNGVRLTGIVANRTVVQCNLDDYSWAFGSIASIFAFFMIRRTRTSQLNLSQV